MSRIADVWNRVRRSLATPSRIGRSPLASNQCEKPATDTDAWDRWSWVWHLAFYALLLLTTVIVLVDGEASARSQALAVTLAAFLGAWFAAVVVWFGGWEKWLLLKVLYVVGALAVWFVLVGLHPVFWLLLFSVYGQIFNLLPIRWSIPASLVTTALVTVRIYVDSPGASLPSILLQGAIWATFGTGMSLWIYSIISQSLKRQGLIEELEKTRNQLAAEERRAGTLEERGRLAREIHDTLAQGFTSVVAHLEAAEGTLKPGNEATLRHLDQARRTARDNLVEARHLVAALRPELLAGSSLPEALERLTNRWSEETDVTAELSVTGDQHSLPQDAQVALLRATQEALANARRHAGAGEVSVTLSYMDDRVALDIQDDGVGFAVDGAGSNGGFGLRSMRERVESLGGSLAVESEPGEGSTLAVELPVATAVTPEQQR